jgi:hypothetical protein
MAFDESQDLDRAEYQQAEPPHPAEPGAGRSADPLNPLVSVVIYVAGCCAVSQYAYEVAETIRRLFPQVALKIVDLADPPEPVPEVVFATPTYLLNGRLWSLGNPSSQEVVRALAEALGQGCQCPTQFD